MKIDWKYGLAVALVAGLGACGDDDTAANNAPGNNTTNNATNNTATNNSNNTNNSDTNNATTNNTTNNDTNNTVVPIDDPPKCGDANEPARCSEDPSSYMWKTASVIDSLVVAGPEDDCCFDFTGDGEPDNGLGELLGTFPDLDVNTGLADNIADGSLVIILEHDDLTDLAGGSYVVNFWVGDWDGITGYDPAGGNAVKIKPESIDAGAQPQAYLPDALLANNKVEAGPGTFILSIDLLGSPLELRLVSTRITADLNAAASSIDNGVALTNGKLGGVIRVEDIIVGVNKFAETCTCLGISGELIDWDNASQSGTCQDTAGSTCVADGEDTCDSIADNCSLIADLLPGFADVDLDGDEQFDGFSLAATFTTVGAKITGVAAQ